MPRQGQPQEAIMTMTADEVFDKVRQVLTEALVVEEEEVTTSAKLVDDLGAESIDFLDIQFRLEKSFGIKIEEGEMFPVNVLDDPQYVLDEKITDKGMEELRQRLAHVDLSEFESDRSVGAVGGVFTVDSVVKFVESKLAGASA